MRKALVIVAVLSMVSLCTSLDQQKPEEREYRNFMRARNVEKAQKLSQSHGQHALFGQTKFSHLSSRQFIAQSTGYMGRSPNEIQNIEARPKALREKMSLTRASANQPRVYAQMSSKAGYFGPGSLSPSVFYVNWNGTNGTYVTNVKNQGACGSCWAFAGVAELESFFLWKHKLYLDLSEQQMVDCLPKVQPTNKGCGGGYLNSVGAYALEYSVTTQRMYPYIQSQNPSCFDDKVAAGKFRIKSYSYTQDCHHIANQLINVRPVGICMQIDDLWQHYKGGVLTTCNTGKKGGHCVLLVGAKSDGTSDPNTNYWIVRNSWGTDYGEYGFMKLFKDPADNEGLCGFCGGGIISA